MISPEDQKLWNDVMAGVTQIVHKSSRHDAPKPRSVIQPTFLSHTLDLHGLTVQEAHDAAVKFVHSARTAGYKRVTIITGLSGQIRNEFPVWINSIPFVREISPVNGGGAFRVKFFKKARK